MSDGKDSTSVTIFMGNGNEDAPNDSTDVKVK